MIKGVPRPSLTWYKNGEPLEQNQKYEIDELTGRLLFVTVDSEDSGNYILRADNSGKFSRDSLAPRLSSALPAYQCHQASRAPSWLSGAIWTL